MTFGRAGTGDGAHSPPARILIADTDPDVWELFARVVARIGHEPLLFPVAATERHTRGVDLLLAEPALTSACALARTLRRERPTLPIVCVSIYPAELLPAEKLRVLAPTAYLVKPCPLAQLHETLNLALGPSRSRQEGPATGIAIRPDRCS